VEAILNPRTVQIYARGAEGKRPHNGGLLSLLRGMERPPPVKNRSEGKLQSEAGNNFDLAQIGEQLKAGPQAQVNAAQTCAPARFD